MRGQEVNGKKKNGVQKEEEVTKEEVNEVASSATVEKKKSDTMKPAVETKPEEAKAVEVEAEKSQQSYLALTGLGGAQKKPSAEPKPPVAVRTKPGPGTPKTVPSTPTAPAKAAGSKEAAAKPDNSGFYGFLKRA
jgi:hypothetical protein